MRTFHLVVRSIVEHRPVLAIRKGATWESNKTDTITEYGPPVWKVVTDQNFSFNCNSKPLDLVAGDILEVTVRRLIVRDEQ